jgi:hypothetical protein
VHLQIDRVVVDGVPLSRRDAARLHSALEARLADELRGGPPTVPGGALASVSAPGVRASRDVDALAAGVAGSIAAGLRGGLHA